MKFIDEKNNCIILHRFFNGVLLYEADFSKIWAIICHALNLHLWTD